MTLFCLVLLWLSGPLQDTAEWYKDLEGFSKSPTEHVIDFLEDPIVVRSVRGLIRNETGPQEPLADVLIEMRGPGNERKIRRARTDRRGRFNMGRVSQGTYRFKATLNGFRSVVGTIVVSKKADKGKDIRIEMRFGV
jgi:hypothetical protein